MDESTSTVAHAGPEHVGRFCTICGEPIQQHQLIQIPGPDAPPVHRRCWEEHREKSPSPPQAPPPPAAAPGTSPMAAPAGAGLPEPPVDHGIGLKVFLIILGTFLPLLGPMIGIVFGFIWLDASNSPLRRRDGRELLIVCSALFVLQIINFVCLIGYFIEMFQSGAFTTPMALSPLP